MGGGLVPVLVHIRFSLDVYILIGILSSAWCLSWCTSDSHTLMNVSGRIGAWDACGPRSCRDKGWM
jgi:hypothetical protein